MLATMQLLAGAPERALQALDAIACTDLNLAEKPLETEIPMHLLSTAPILEAHAVRRGMRVERAPVEEAMGRIAAETIELYPPGTPVMAPGWVIDNASLEALERARRAGGRVIARDHSLATVAVVADGRSSKRCSQLKWKAL